MLRHKETRDSPFSVEQLFNLVADVENYDQFLPWCNKSTILKRKGNIFEAELEISFKAFSESYISRVELKRLSKTRNEAEIIVEMIEGPFSHLYNFWKFKPTETGCEIYFEIDFKFNSIILEKLIGIVFSRAAKTMVRSFEDRALELYLK